MATIYMQHQQCLEAPPSDKHISFKCMTKMNHQNKCCPVEMPRNSLEQDRTDVKTCPQIFLFTTLPS